MCLSSHSSLSRTSTTIASPLSNFAAASCGEISVICFFASATNFWKPPCSAIAESIRRLRRLPQISAVICLRMPTARRVDRRYRRGDLVTDSLFGGLGVKRFSHFLIEGVAFAFSREAFVFRLNIGFAFLRQFDDLLLQVGAFVTGFCDPLFA